MRVFKLVVLLLITSKINPVLIMYNNSLVWIINQNIVSKEIIIRSNSTAVDFALLKNGKLIELHKQNDSNKFNVGDIFLAKTKKTISGLERLVLSLPDT